ncbi:MAG: PIN domain-containing protein [Deltaproteobacteria bacterium]|nr:PIN domain-containing protein [Deltaproteobacteria bacterium]
MKTIFVDTSAFYALFNRDDPHHEEAVSAYQEEDDLLVTTHTVFSELLSLLTKRQGKQMAIRCGKEMKASQRLQIVHAKEAEEEKAWELFCRFKDKDYDLVDCLSFVYMQEQGIDDAFAFDRHFVQHGFRLLKRRG